MMSKLKNLIMNKTKISRSKNAFTLVEVMVAMLVLAIGLLGLAGMTIVVLRSNVLSRQISEATTITSNLMENLKLQSFSTLSSAACSTNLVNASNCEILEESGITALGNGFIPLGSVDTSCAISGMVTNFNTGDAATYDMITANLQTFNAVAPTSVTSFCTDFENMPNGRYVRYYRIFDPGSSGTEMQINVVTLWKDRFGKWRNLRLTTIRSGS